MGETTNFGTGRWIAAALVVAMVGVFAFVLVMQSDPEEQSEATAAPTAVAQVDTPTVSEATATSPPTASTAPSEPATSPAESPTSRPAASTSTATQAPPTSTATSEPTPTSIREESTPTAAPPTATPRQLPPCDVECVQIGVTLENFPGPFSAISDFGELSGRMPDMVMFFQAWGDADAAFKDWLPELSGMGVAPLITWEPWHRAAFLDQSDYTLQSILDGQHDAYIDDWAQRSAAHGQPIYLRFAHEMNTPPGEVYWYPWQGDPARYVAVWRYVHDRFTAAGATNVEWVWSVAWMNSDAEAYYPGDDYVDWVGLTVLNFGTTVEGPGWRTFSTLYNQQDGGISQSDRAASFGKPVMITELATVEQGGDKGQWIIDIGPALQDEFPEVRAIVWNNYSQARHEPEANWSVNSSEGALAGWRELMSSPYITSPAARMRLTWARTDRPVGEGRAVRTWMWAPEPFTDVRDEAYGDAPGGIRKVRYFDKSRMEITDPDASWTSPWYVTNGLLATELITGRVQTGDNSFEDRLPAAINVAGDPDDPSAPTYASFAGLTGWSGLPVDTPLVQRLSRGGSVADDPSLAGHDVRAAYYVPETGHTVAGPFWAFMNSIGTVWHFGLFVEAELFQNPFFATGFPITEAYWVTAKVTGIPRDVLVQCFERRCLTYTPGNAPEWRVEAGNVGRHYFAWRFGE